RESPELPLADVAYTLQVGRAAFNHRRFVIGNDHAAVVAALDESPVATSSHQTHREPPVVFVLPGATPGALEFVRDLSSTEPTFRERADEACSALASALELEPLGSDPRCAGPTAFVLGYALA